MKPNQTKPNQIKLEMKLDMLDPGIIQKIENEIFHQKDR